MEDMTKFNEKFVRNLAHKVQKVLEDLIHQLPPGAMMTFVVRYEGDNPIGFAMTTDDDVETAIAMLRGVSNTTTH